MDYSARHVSLLVVSDFIDNLGVLYGETHRFADAEAAFKEAAGIRHDLAAQNPAAYRPDLAATLNNLGYLYWATHRFAEAEAALKEAAGIRRELAAQNPAAYRSDLTMTLNNPLLCTVACTAMATQELQRPRRWPRRSSARLPEGKGASDVSMAAPARREAALERKWASPPENKRAEPPDQIAELLRIIGEIPAPRSEFSAARRGQPLKGGNRMRRRSEVPAQRNPLVDPMLRRWIAGR